MMCTLAGFPEEFAWGHQSNSSGEQPDSGCSVAELLLRTAELQSGLHSFISPGPSIRAHQLRKFRPHALRILAGGKILLVLDPLLHLLVQLL